jgi:hypothetical protein
MLSRFIFANLSWHLRYVKSIIFMTLKENKKRVLWVLKFIIKKILITRVFKMHSIRFSSWSEQVLYIHLLCLG